MTLCVRRLRHSFSRRDFRTPRMVSQDEVLQNSSMLHNSKSFVPPSATDAYVEERCAAVQRLEYWTFAGRDHLTIIQSGTPLEDPLIKWTTARFANEPQQPGCVRKS